MPMSRNSVQLMSNMKSSPAAPSSAAAADQDVKLPRRRESTRKLDFALGFGPPLDLRGCLMIDRLLPVGFRAVGGLVIRHAFLEGFNAARDIAHHIRNLVAASEHQQDDGADDQPVPDAQGTHKILRPPDPYAYLLNLRHASWQVADLSQKLGVGTGKNKHAGQCRCAAGKRTG